MKVTLIILSFLLMVVGTGNTSEIGFKGIGIKAGYVFPEEPIESTLSFGGYVDLGEIIPNLRLEGGIEYWSSDYKEKMFGIPYEWKWSDLTFLGRVKYIFPIEGFAGKLYAGGGLGLHRFSYEWEYEYWDWWEDRIIRGSESDSKSEIQLHGVGGVEFPISPTLRAFGEVKLVMGDVDYSGIFGGITFPLGRR